MVFLMFYFPSVWYLYIAIKAREWGFQLCVPVGREDRIEKQRESVFFSVDRDKIKINS